MRKISFILICISLVLNSIYGQENESVNFCGTKPGKSQWLVDYQKHSLLATERTNEKYYMPMTVSILTNDDGSKSYSLNDVLDEICQLNKDFEAVGFYFYLNSPIRYIANTVWNNHKDFGEGYEMFERNVKNTINVYYCSDAAGNCGYNISGIGTVLAKGCMGVLSHTWAHEMGHEFSLPHTFVGWEGAKYNPALVPDSINGYEVELFNRSNCKTAADGFCDTQADYLNYRWNCQPDGKSPTQLKDPKGQTFRADGSFFMSYSTSDCMNRFSNEQITTMRANCLAEKSDFLAKSLTIQNLQDSVEVRSPVNNALLKPDNVVLNWKKNNNYSHYYFEVARDRNFNFIVESKQTTDTFAQLRTLLFSKDYFWRITGFNLTTTCRPATIAKSFRFKTDDSFSSTADIDLLANLMVYPNPLRPETPLQIELFSRKSGRIVVSLYELNGRLISKRDYQISEGDNNFSIQTEGLVSGMYVLSVDDSQSSILRKLVVF